MQKHIEFLEKETNYFIRERHLLALLERTRLEMLKRIYTNCHDLKQSFNEIASAIDENRKDYTRQTEILKSEAKRIVQNRQPAVLRNIKARPELYRIG
jgi:hypothetical protein